MLINGKEINLQTVSIALAKPISITGNINSPVDSIPVVHVHIVSGADGRTPLAGRVAAPHLAHRAAVARAYGHY